MINIKNIQQGDKVSYIPEYYKQDNKFKIENKL